MQQKKKKVQVEKFEEEEKDEDDIEGLEDFDPEGEIDSEKSDEDVLKEDIEKLKGVKTKIIEVITVNQKYIKRNHERIKELEDNFKILLEKIK